MLGAVARRERDVVSLDKVSFMKQGGVWKGELALILFNHDSGVVVSTLV